jgi:hypothetical protein
MEQSNYVIHSERGMKFNIEVLSFSENRPLDQKQFNKFGKKEEMEQKAGRREEWSSVKGTRGNIFWFRMSGVSVKWTREKLFNNAEMSEWFTPCYDYQEKFEKIVDGRLVEIEQSTIKMVYFAVHGDAVEDGVDMLEVPQRIKFGKTSFIIELFKVEKAKKNGPLTLLPKQVKYCEEEPAEGAWRTSKPSGNTFYKEKTGSRGSKSKRRCPTFSFSEKTDKLADLADLYAASRTKMDHSLYNVLLRPTLPLSVKKFLQAQAFCTTPMKFWCNQA